MSRHSRGVASVRRASAADMAGGVPTKKVWVSFVNGADAKPGSITSGFQYGQELAIVCENDGTLYACSNKVPPTGQPATYAQFGLKKGTIIEPITQTAYDLKTGKHVGKWCPGGIGKLIIGRLVGPQTLTTFPVKREGGSVKCLINVNAKAQFEQGYWRGVLDSQGKVDGGYY